MDEQTLRAPTAFREIGRRVSNRGRWGAEDELGTLNYITPETLVAAARLVRRGAIFDLGIPIDSHGPSALEGRINPVHLMSQAGGPQQRYPGGIKWADDYIIMPTHSATQWDSFAHVWYDGELYNGFPEDSVTPVGAKHGAIDAFAKGIAGRGVLLDVARLHDVAWLEGGYLVTPEDFERAAERQGVELRPGDILLFRTGWRRKFLAERSAEAWMATEPGIGVGAADWLHAMRVAALCSDNWGIEVIPNEDPDVLNPVHMLLLRDMGCRLAKSSTSRSSRRTVRGTACTNSSFAGRPSRSRGALAHRLTRWPSSSA